MMSPMALRRTISKLSNRGALAGREKDSVIFNRVTRVAAPKPAVISTTSRFSRLQPRAGTNQFSGRVIFRITHDHNAASAGFDLAALGDALRRVVRAFGMKVRANFADDRAHVIF